MNRADQAPEPSIEELLASIRLIISDADKQDPSQREPRALGGPSGDGLSLYGPGEVSADEVFDLTDELMPTVVEAVRPQPGSQQPVTRLQPSFESQAGAQNFRRGGALQPPEGAAAQMRAMHEPPAHALRPDTRRPVQAQASRHAGARREAPIDAAHSPVAPGAPGQEQIAARHPARNWNGDVQMPVPDQGPVSLFPSQAGKGQPERPGAAAGNATGNQTAPSTQQQAAAQDANGGQADVSALAERLARSAIGVLEASELENATQVDFEHLDASSKAEVAEKFAVAIETAAHAVQEELSAPPEKAQVRQAAPQGQPAAKSAAAGARPQGGDSQNDIKTNVAAKPEVPAKAEAPKQATAPVEAEAPIRPQPRELPAGPVQEAVRPAAEPAKAGAAEPAQVAARTAAAEPVKTEAPAQGTLARPSAAPVPLAVQPLVQAQFVGSAQPPVPSQGGGALESVVREMLRPLLVQWLNENMPRILENAIREEISSRGLLPKSNS